MVGESYVRSDATGAETRLALRNDLDDASVYTAIVRSQRVASTMQQLPGDAVFFHSNLLHRSDQNTSDQARWSLICCYNTRHNDLFITAGRHPNYSPLEIWPDERVMESIKQQTASGTYRISVPRTFSSFECPR